MYVKEFENKEILLDFLKYDKILPKHIYQDEHFKNYYLIYDILSDRGRFTYDVININGRKIRRSTINDSDVDTFDSIAEMIALFLSENVDVDKIIFDLKPEDYV